MAFHACRVVFYPAIPCFGSASMGNNSSSTKSYATALVTCVPPVNVEDGSGKEKETSTQGDGERERQKDLERNLWLKVSRTPPSGTLVASDVARQFFQPTRCGCGSMEPTGRAARGLQLLLDESGVGGLVSQARPRPRCGPSLPHPWSSSQGAYSRCLACSGVDRMRPAPRAAFWGWMGHGLHPRRLDQMAWATEVSVVRAGARPRKPGH